MSRKHANTVGGVAMARVYYSDRKARHHIGAAAAARQKASGDHHRRAPRCSRRASSAGRLPKPLPEGENRSRLSVTSRKGRRRWPIFRSAKLGLVIISIPTIAACAPSIRRAGRSPLAASVWRRADIEPRRGLQRRDGDSAIRAGHTYTFKSHYQWLQIP